MELCLHGKPSMLLQTNSMSVDYWRLSIHQHTWCITGRLNGGYFNPGHVHLQLSMHNWLPFLESADLMLHPSWKWTMVLFKSSEVTAFVGRLIKISGCYVLNWTKTWLLVKPWLVCIKDKHSCVQNSSLYAYSTEFIFFINSTTSHCETQRCLLTQWDISPEDHRKYNRSHLSHFLHTWACSNCLQHCIHLNTKRWKHHPTEQMTSTYYNNHI